MTMADGKVWLISGCSTGFGRALAELVIARGDRAVVTARDASRVTDLAKGAEDRVLALPLDVTRPDQIAAVVADADDRFGRIDVLVNNAGYGYQASVEEGEEGEIRAQFDANVFGLFALTRAVLPILRRQRSGRILNITSVGGLIGFHASGYYSATKHAVEGWSDALRAEVAPLGIGVTCVEPGPFRTDWAGRSLRQTPSRISDYADTVAKRMAQTKGYSGTQADDPVRAGEAMIAIVERDDPPRHLVLGRFGYDAVVEKLQERLAEIQGLRELSLSADFPEEEA
jgi:NAD(P)-dependent dehydrogenase (short-subunit alcohol dehydrogenase family)